MSWLYRACYSCAMELYLDKPTTKHISFFKNMIYLLKCYNIKPILIFDGRKLEAKAETNENRF